MQYKKLSEGYQSRCDEMEKLEAVFDDRQTIEGYALDWNPLKRGILASGLITQIINEFKLFR